MGPLWKCIFNLTGKKAFHMERQICTDYHETSFKELEKHNHKYIPNVEHSLCIHHANLSTT